MAALSLLVQHFRDLEQEHGPLELSESRWLTSEDEPADLEKGVLVTYGARSGSGEVRVWVSPRRVKLKAHWEDHHGLSQLEDRFVVTLGERPTWGDRQFDSLRALAVALVDLMRRRLSELPVAPPGPTEPSTSAEEPREMTATTR